jgi:hypothetical protein
MVTVMYGATKTPVSLPAAIAQRWYTANRETVDVLDDGNPRLSGSHGRQECSRTALSEENGCTSLKQSCTRWRRNGLASWMMLFLRSAMFGLLIRNYFTTKTNWGALAVWALVFEAALIVAIAIVWKLRVSMR